MENRLLESSLVFLLLLGYFALWKFRRRKIIKLNGVDPEVIYSDNRPSQQFFSVLMRMMSFSIVILILLNYIDSIGFCKLAFFANSVFYFIGFSIGLGGLFLCLKAQNEMGDSWRVGIEKGEKTDLVTTGIFEKIRNPTYSGLFLVCLGSFVIIPSTAVMVWGIIFYISIEFQVRIEEEHLTDAHGDRYVLYCKKSKRYIPYLY